MKSIHLILGCHAHQPIGNFDFVFDEAYEKSYRPFIEVLERYPNIKATMHYTGPLWDWFEAHAPEFIGKLRRMSDSGQIEIMGGAYYEPLLCAIPERDSTAQIRRMQQFCEKHFGRTPRGMWLTERVWEPHMARILASAGVEYAALDDSHFLVSGLEADQLFGYYMTEDEGNVLKVFPIHERLRYTIPFMEVEQTIAFLREHADESGRRCAVFHDDNEKFGVWPGTYNSVYEEGWLERFFHALRDNSDWIHSVTYSEFIDRVPPLGRTYITCASYHEMMGWALPTPMQRKLYAIEKELEAEPEKKQHYGVFLRGGFWRNFLAKYEESNNLQKRMLCVSRRYEALRHDTAHCAELDEAGRLLHQAQCNCAYWHGVFGGLYLNHLRSAVFESCIAADAVLDAVEHAGASWNTVARYDFDGDGQEDVILDNRHARLIVSPADGGTLFEWDYKPRPFNVLSVLTRRAEAYHDKLALAETVHADGHEGATSIHDIIHAKEPGLQGLLNYDRQRRASLRDRFFPVDTPLEALWRDDYTELSTLPASPYACAEVPGGVRLFAASMLDGLVPSHITIEKTLVLAPDASRLSVAYTITNAGSTPVDEQFGVDWSINFMAGDAHDRYYASRERDLGRQRLNVHAEDQHLGHIALVDEYLGLQADIGFSLPAKVYRFPLETVSQSEGGQERVYQGSTVLPSWRLQLAPQEQFTVTLTATVGPVA
jgi:alpha-amylase/alpha-mannosidase (GH57 family)